MREALHCVLSCRGASGPQERRSRDERGHDSCVSSRSWRMCVRPARWRAVPRCAAGRAPRPRPGSDSRRSCAAPCAARCSSLSQVRALLHTKRRENRLCVCAVCATGALHSYFSARAIGSRGDGHAHHVSCEPLLASHLHARSKSNPPAPRRQMRTRTCIYHFLACCSLRRHGAVRVTRCCSPWAGPGRVAGEGCARNMHMMRDWLNVCAPHWQRESPQRPSRRRSRRSSGWRVP